MWRPTLDVIFWCSSKWSMLGKKISHSILFDNSVHFSQTMDHDYLQDDIWTNFLLSLLWTQINIVCSMLVRITLIHVNDTVVICIDIILSQPLAEIYNCMYDWLYRKREIILHIGKTFFLQFFYLYWLKFICPILSTFFGYS